MKDELDWLNSLVPAIQLALAATTLFSDGLGR